MRYLKDDCLKLVFYSARARNEIVCFVRNRKDLMMRNDQLDPYTYYYYRFEYNGVYSNTGRTKTAPLEEN